MSEFVWPEDTWKDYGYEERPDYWCDVCEEDVGPSSHYHCSKCGQITGMMAHFAGLDRPFSCED